jgi:hypothetical protein
MSLFVRVRSEGQEGGPGHRSLPRKVVGVLGFATLAGRRDQVAGVGPDAPTKSFSPDDLLPAGHFGVAVGR